MASVANDPGGRRRILFVDPSGDRKAIRLGKVSGRAAEGVKHRVEQLLESQLLKRPMEADLAGWVYELDARMAKKLAAVGLIPKPEQKAAATLGQFLTDYIASRTDVKPLTTRHLNDARRNLVAFFGEDKALADISPGDADEFRRDLLLRLGDNTVRRQCGRAKQFLRAALRKRLIRENPFADMKGCGVQANRSRDYFLTREDAAKVLEACPDAQWRLIFALSRFGGLRCPSEHLALRWGDVDWERERICVRSPKTEHHEGGESRWIPMFPELRPSLEQAWDEAEPGTEYVITRYRSANTNLRTHLERIIRRAGLEPWPKLFHNLRATRETELAQSFPLHVVCSWIGNSQAVAAKHYLQVTDEHFRDGTKPAPKAAQNAAQQAHVESRTESQAALTAHENTPVFPGRATIFDTVKTYSVPPVGLEPTTL
jgi:integrase